MLPAVGAPLVVVFVEGLLPESWPTLPQHPLPRAALCGRLLSMFRVLLSPSLVVERLSTPLT